MREITQIKTEPEYEAALVRIDDLIHSAQGSEEDAELERISNLVIRYEDEHYPIGNPTPDALVEFLLDQEIVMRGQLIPLVGSSAGLDGTVAGQREITPELAQLLHEHSGISVEDLIIASPESNQRLESRPPRVDPP